MYNAQTIFDMEVVIREVLFSTVKRAIPCTMYSTEYMHPVNYFRARVISNHKDC